MSKETGQPETPPVVDGPHEKETSTDYNNTLTPDTALEAVKNINKSPGVVRIEAISSVITTTDRWFIFFGVFIIAYAYGLDGTLRYSYQPYATASYASHSLLSTINVVRAVIAAAAQPTSARIADVFGRVELTCASVFFYIIGTIVEACSNNVASFAAGAVIYQIGYTMVILLVEVIVADITSTRSRLFFSFVPVTPFLINAWVAGDVAQAVLDSTTWHWGIGMWAIIYTVCAMPLIISLSLIARRAKKMGRLDDYRSSFQTLGGKNFLVELFWLLDVPGIILMIATLALILVPLTTSGGFGGPEKWKSADTLAPLIIGFLCLPAFIAWEFKAPHPLIPFYLMKDRAIWAPMGIGIFLNFSWYMQGDYLFTVLRVSFDASIKSATRITSLFSFTSVLTGTLLGLVVYKVKIIKPFIVFGTCLFMAAMGMLVHYRGEPSGAGTAGIIAAQVLLGMGAGFFTYPTQVVLQVYTKHEHLAVMTASYLCMYQIGSALGNSVSGAIWTQVLPGELSKRLAGVNETLAVSSYGDPFTAIIEWPIGTPERSGVIAGYQHVQRLLTIAGLCISTLLIAFSLCLRNPKLNDRQTLVEDDDHITKRRLSTV